MAGISVRIVSSVYIPNPFPDNSKNLKSMKYPCASSNNLRPFFLALVGIPFLTISLQAQILIDTNFNDNTAQGWVGYNSGNNFGPAATNIGITTSSANLQVVGSPATSFGGVARLFDGTRPFTLAVGDIMTLKFDVQWVSSLPASDSGFRWGFMAWNEDSPLTASSDNGYFATVRVGTGTANANIQKDNGSGTSFLAGSDVSNLQSTASFSGITAVATWYEATFTINRISATQVQLGASFNDVNYTSTTDSTSPFFSFSSVFIGTGGVNPNFRIDNVSLIAVPEPTTALLFGGGALLGILFLRRRCGNICGY